MPVFAYASPIIRKDKPIELDSLFTLQPDENGLVAFEIVKDYKLSSEQNHGEMLVSDIRGSLQPLTAAILEMFKKIDETVYIYILELDESVVESCLALSDYNIEKKYSDSRLSKTEIEAVKSNPSNSHALRQLDKIGIYEIPIRKIKIAGLLETSLTHRLVYLNKDENTTTCLDILKNHWMPGTFKEKVHSFTIEITPLPKLKTIFKQHQSKDTAFNFEEPSPPKKTM